MKILYVITKSNWGGAQKYVFDLALQMQGFGHDVAVAFGGHGELAKKLEEKNIRTIQIEGLERDVDFVKEFKVLKNLAEVFKKENPDVLHLNSSKIGILGAILARMLKLKKIIFTAHGFAFREDRAFWQIVLIKFLSWLTILFSHKTICVSERDFDDVKNWLFINNKVVTIHNGIEIKEIPNTLPLQGETVNIVSIGELHKNKGFIYALEAINLLRYKLQNFKYTIFSFGGDEERRINKMISDLNLQDFVELLISKEKADDKLNNFDIYLLPSIKEGLPYVLLEAGLNYLPIIASDTGGVNEIVENYKNGLLVKPKDVHALEMALEKLISDKNLRQDFGKKGREIIENNFDLENMIAKTTSFYL